MAREDADMRAIYADQVMLANYKVWPINTGEGFTRQRWGEYQSLFAKLKGYDIDSLSKGASIIHIPASIVVSRSEDYESIVITKGYAYSLGEPVSLVESLNEMGFDSRDAYYKKIGEHWYLYHAWGVSKPE
ncbi:MAG: hypothetical protein ACJ74W_24625 [Pyrinomonadaceae bacterium]